MDMSYRMCQIFLQSRYFFRDKRQLKVEEVGTKTDNLFPRTEQKTISLQVLFLFRLINNKTKKIVQK